MTATRNGRGGEAGRLWMEAFGSGQAVKARDILVRVAAVDEGGSR